MNCQHPHRPACSGVVSLRWKRQRCSRPCSLLQPVSYSQGKKILRQLHLGPFQNAFLITFEAEQIIGPALLSKVAGGLLLTLHGIGSDHAALQAGECFESRQAGTVPGSRYFFLQWPVGLR